MYVFDPAKHAKSKGNDDEDGSENGRNGEQTQSQEA